MQPRLPLRGEHTLPNYDIIQRRLHPLSDASPTDKPRPITFWSVGAYEADACAQHKREGGEATGSSNAVLIMEERGGGGSKAEEAADCVSLVKLREENLGLLRHLNAVLFPVHYQQRYYTQALASGPFSQLAFYRDTCVGSITCRIEKTFAGRHLYILTLGVLAPYRRLGIGSKLMRLVLELSEKEEDLLEVYLHVQVNNEEALEFYEKFGFKIRDLIRNYYRRIDPPDCYLLSKDLAGKKLAQAVGKPDILYDR